MGELAGAKSKSSQKNASSSSLSSQAPAAAAANSVDKDGDKLASAGALGTRQAGEPQPGSERKSSFRTGTVSSALQCRSSKSFEGEPSLSSGDPLLAGSGTQTKSCLGPVRSLDSTKSNESSSTITNLDHTTASSTKNLTDVARSAGSEASDASKGPQAISSTRRRASAAPKNVTASSSSNCVSSIAPASQQKQMFSLKQLAINSRNLTSGKKRASLQSTGTSIEGASASNSNNADSSAKHFPFKFKVNNTSSDQLIVGSKSNRSHRDKLSNSNCNSSDNFDSEDDEDCEENDCTDDDDCSDSDDYGDEEQDDDDELTNSSDDDFDDDDNNSLLSDGEHEDDRRDEGGLGADPGDQSCAGTSFSGNKREQQRREKENQKNLKAKMKKKDDSQKKSAKDRETSNMSLFNVGRKSKKRRSDRNARNRRGSSCNCELVINRIDFDGQPVTDVDFVTYKHLCHLEQRQQQIKANLRKKQWQSPGGRSSLEATGREQQPAHLYQSLYENATNFFDDFRPPPPPPSKQYPSQHQKGLAGPLPLTASCRLNHLKPHQRASSSMSIRSSQLKRRSSLQEESGAYYQLCTSAEEQTIRQKYVWFPPSLKTLPLVDQFFSCFSKDKIPYAPATANQQQPQSQATSKDSPPTLGPTTSSKLSNPNASSKQTAPAEAQPPMNSTSSSSSQPASSLVCSYRDEQISFQLPRQDISLDYCSYNMDEQGRANYGQFVNKRNSQALDVASVIQVSLVANAASSGGQKQSAGEQLASGGGTGPRQRKQSTASQIVVSDSSCSGSGGAVASQQVPPVSQRCRRCLVRFEDGQLAVVAPNFSIGTGIYSHHHHHHHRHNAQSSNKNSNQHGQQHQYLASGKQQAGATSDSVPGELSSRRASVSLLQQTSGLLEYQADQAAPISLLAPKAGASSGAARVVPAKPNLAMFHPQCFTCSTCKEFLVDLVYCLRDSKLYCLRHYGESIRPRCNWCQELIFSDEYLKAMNENFHIDHFLCRHCDSNLAGQRYVLKEEKPYCISCYEENFANNCEDCQKPIGIDSRDLSYKDRHWHDTCFLCQKCQQSLIDKPFGSKGDKVYCADCYDTTFATRCDGCKNPFRAGSKKMEYRGRQWHDSCFCCCVCQNTIGSNSFIPKNEDIYCIKCYEDKYATRCTKCKQVIVSGGVTFRNEPWHRECFSCCNCDKSLAGQRFTTKDLNSLTPSDSSLATKNLNKTNQPHNAYCIDCYGELFAKKCFACTQAITGLGGTRFVTFEDRSWHNDCFLCNDCQSSLVGKGFITDGPDTILCGECARAKLR